MPLREIGTVLLRLSVFCYFQVLAACFYPALLEDDSLPLDVKERADDLLRQCDGGSVGKLLSLPSRYIGIPCCFHTFKCLALY